MADDILSQFLDSLKSFLQELHNDNFQQKTLDDILNQDGMDINYQDSDGNSFLHLCVMNNKLECTKYLIKKDINVSLKNNKGELSIHISVNNNCVEILEELLKSPHVDINQTDSEKRSLLQNAVINGNEEIIDILLNKGININNLDNHNRNVIFDAIIFDKRKITDKLLEYKELNLNVIDDMGDTILHKKELLSNVFLVRRLVEHGADPTIKNRKKQNALCYIAIHGADAIILIDEVVKQGYSLDVTRDGKRTKLLEESLKIFYKIPKIETEERDGFLNMFSQLIKRDININVLNSYSENVLFDAIRHNELKICEILINVNININQLNRLQQTPLYIASLMGISHIKIIFLLLKNGVDIDIRNENDENILEILNNIILHINELKLLKQKYLIKQIDKNKNYDMIIHEILKHSRDNIIKYSSIEQPLFFTPLLFGDYKIFKYYIANGYDINATDENGVNIFYLYVKIALSINRYFDSFKDIIIQLIQDGVDVMFKNDKGNTVFFEMINENTNIELYKDLLSTTKIGITSKDKSGKTLMHYAVFYKNIKMIALLNEFDNQLLNIDDTYGILPVVYAALFNQYNIVKELFKNETILVKNDKVIHNLIKQKFQSFLGNLDQIELSSKDDENMKTKVTILVKEIKAMFLIQKDN